MYNPDMNHGIAACVVSKGSHSREKPQTEIYFDLVSFTTQGEGEGRTEKWTGNSLALASGSSQSSRERTVKHSKMRAINK